jgi:hypothetical protein
MNTSINSAIVALAAVVAGWFLGETTGFLKKWWSVHNLKKSLFVEIEDALGWMKRNKITLEHIIQLTVLKERTEIAPVKVPTHIYDNHFPEISPHLTKSQRVSYNSIYNLMHLSYQDVQRLIELARAQPYDNAKDKEFATILESTYYNVCTAIYQIQYHLANYKHLNVNELTGEHAKQLDNDILNRLNKIISEAKEVGLEELKRRHYET